MYNAQSKIALENRIGWSNPIPPNTEITLTAENVVSVSDRFFNSFHQLAIVENVFYTIPNKEVTNAELNIFLTDLRKQVILQVLNKVFDTNIYANTKSTNEFVSINYSLDYSDLIIEKQSLFDEAIGYLMASKCMQLFLTTSRSNSKERTIQTSYQVLKIELEGVRDENGKVIANGVSQMADLAINNIISILFPIKKKSEAKIFGRKPW